MDVSKNWHVLFVLGTYEEKIMNRINELSDKYPVIAFVPKVERSFKKQKKITYDYEIVFKNYVFVQTDLNFVEFSIFVDSNLRKVEGFIKLLKHDSEGTESLYPQEKLMIQRFVDPEYVVRESLGLIEGDKIIVLSGPLKGQESLIRKIDRHKRKAWIEISMFGQSQLVEVGLEIIAKS